MCVLYCEREKVEVAHDGWFETVLCGCKQVKKGLPPILRRASVIVGSVREALKKKNGKKRGHCPNVGGRGVNPSALI